MFYTFIINISERIGISLEIVQTVGICSSGTTSENKACDFSRSTVFVSKSTQVDSFVFCGKK